MQHDESESSLLKS